MIDFTDRLRVEIRYRLRIFKKQKNASPQRAALYLGAMSGFLASAARPPLDAPQMTLATPTLNLILSRNFGELVLGCIDSYDSEQRRILQPFSRSTRFAFFCTAPISVIQQKFVILFSDVCCEFRKFASCCSISSFFGSILMSISRNFTNFTNCVY